MSKWSPNKYKPRKNTPKELRNPDPSEQEQNVDSLLNKLKKHRHTNPRILQNGLGHKPRGRKKTKR